MPIDPPLPTPTREELIKTIREAEATLMSQKAMLENMARLLVQGRDLMIEYDSTLQKTAAALRALPDRNAGDGHSYRIAMNLWSASIGRPLLDELTEGGY